MNFFDKLKDFIKSISGKDFEEIKSNLQKVKINPSLAIGGAVGGVIAIMIILSTISSICSTSNSTQIPTPTPTALIRNALERSVIQEGKVKSDTGEITEKYSYISANKYNLSSMSVNEFSSYVKRVVPELKAQGNNRFCIKFYDGTGIVFSECNYQFLDYGNIDDNNTIIGTPITVDVDNETELYKFLLSLPTATPIPTQSPTPVPTVEPTPEPTEEPTPEPTQIPTSEPKAAASSSDDEEEMVWVGNTGNKYHKQGCGTLRGKGHKITKKAALAQGREACKKCGG